jgi:hypothetical protein
MSRSDAGRVRQMFLWGFPLGAFVATWVYWPVVQGTGLAFPLYVLSVPFLFALVLVPTVTAYLRLWSWKMPLFHLAFLWSTYSALGVLIVGDTIAAPFTVLAAIKSAALCALLGGGIGALVDIVGIDEGLLELHYTTPERGTVNTVLSYSFKFFGIFGAIYGVVAKAGYSFLVELGATRWLPALILSTSAVLCLPFLIHFLLPGKARRLNTTFIAR